MFMSIIKAIINPTAFGSFRQSSQLAFVVGMQESMATLGENGLSLVPSTHSLFLSLQLSSAQRQ